MTTEFQYDVFLSHNQADKPRVRKLAERLKQAGLRVWFDEWVIKAGNDIYLAIERGLEATRVEVLCLSPAALGSEWVALERSTVLFRDPTNQGRRFVPLLLADCARPDTLRRYRYVDFRQEDDAAFRELLAACRADTQANPLTIEATEASPGSFAGPPEWSVNSLPAKTPRLVPIVHATKPSPGQSHSFRICLENKGTATAELIQLTVKTSEVGLPCFSPGFWRMGPCHVPYSFETDRSLNPRTQKRVFEVGFQQDPEQFTFEFNISAKDILPEQWMIKFSREESRKLVPKEGAAEGQRDSDAFVMSAKRETSTKSFQDWAGGEQVTLAIVFTDVVGSTVLGEEIRDEAMNEVRRAHFAQSRRLIEQFQGWEIKTIGDSVMAAFKCAGAALDYARALRGNTGHPQVQVRAGIHIGPMHVEAEDVFGGTVNFAARVVGAIQGAEIWLSEGAKEDIDRLGAAKYRALKWVRHDLEPGQLKGFPGKFKLWVVGE